MKRLLFVLLFCSCQSDEVKTKDPSLAHIPVKSKAKGNLAEFQKLTQTKSRRESESPESISLKMLNGSDEAKKLNLSLEYDRSENPSFVTVTIRREGLLDDSLRGDWHQFKFQREKKLWKLKEVHQAYLCWRGEIQAFQKGLCP